MFMTRSSSIASANWGHIYEGGRAGWPAPTRRSAPRLERRAAPTFPSTARLLLIDPDAVAAKLYSRPDEGAWSDVDLIGRDAVVDLSAIEVALPLAALYERIDLPA
jgi:hypothetical protein